MKKGLTVKYYIDFCRDMDDKISPFKKMRISKKQFDEQMKHLKDMLSSLKNEFDEGMFVEAINTYDYEEHTVTEYTFGYTEECYDEDDSLFDENNVLLPDADASILRFVERTTLTVDRCKKGYVFANK